jgi:hypothetical protein
MRRLCQARAVLKVTSQGHGTARHGHRMACVNDHRAFRDGMPTVDFFRQPRGVPGRLLSEVYLSLNCRTSSSDISGYHTEFHEGHGTVGELQGRGMACVN